MSWFKALAGSMVKYGAKALAGAVPFGEVMLDVAKDLWDKYRKPREAGQAANLAVDLQAAALPASAGEVQREIAAAVDEAAREQPPEVKKALTEYLTQAPFAIRRSLRRPSDPSGTTVPATLAFQQPRDLVPFLPSALPRFKAGERPWVGAPFVLREMLGKGGFGEVWLASHPTDHKLLKALKFCLDDKAARSLRHEAKALARVRDEGKHAGIVDLRWVWDENEPLCLEYEFVAGGDLGSLIREMHAGGPPSPDTVARWMLNLLEPIRFVHSLKPPIVHRDLKPANILVERQKDGKFRLRVADFGISDVAAQEALRDTANQSLMTIGVGGFTALYASPQQMRDAPADPRDDIHALGVIWLQMLTGDLNKGRPTGSGWKLPLRGRGTTEPMLELLEQCMDDEPSVRPNDAGDLAAKLSALVGVKQETGSGGGGGGTSLVEKVRRERQEAEKANAKARKEVQEERYAVAVESLKPIAAHLQEPGLLDTAARNAAEVTRLDAEIPVLVNAGRHREARALIKQLLGLQRRRDDMRELLDELKEPELPREIVNSLGMKLMLIPAGTFLMGSPDGEGSSDEHPQHEVELTRNFYMGAFQVTQEQYQRVMGQNPSWFCAAGAGKDAVKGIDTKRFPVEQVTWDEAVAFCERLSNLPEEKKAGRLYHLPTEAMWEYSCRGGATSHSLYHFGNSLSPKQANFSDSKLGRPCPVGSFAANAFGLFDMHGNVWEWCEDCYDENFYRNSSKRDPQGPQKGERRVLRGGSWSYNAEHCRSASRYWVAPGDRSDDVGFRVCFLLDF